MLFYCASIAAIVIFVPAVIIIPKKKGWQWRFWSLMKSILKTTLAQIGVANDDDDDDNVGVRASSTF